MRVTLASIGTRGDIEPILALGQALRRRGHEALIACPAAFAARVRALGFVHHPLGDDRLARMAAPGGSSADGAGRSLRAIQQYLADTLPPQFPRLLAIAGSSDALVATGLALAGTSVAEKLSIPVLKLTFSTVALPSRAHPPPFVPWRGLPSWLNRLSWRLADALQERMLAPAIHAGRAQLGLAPLAHLGRHLFADTRTVIAADEVLLPADPAWQGRHPHAGFLFLEDPAPLDPALAAWLAAGEPPVYVGFGSMKGPRSVRANERLRQALVALRRRCLVAGWDGLGQARCDRVFVIDEAPHHLLFPRVAAVVHHGGAGTVASALRAGVPQVVLPVALDQFHHAHALRRAGLAPDAPTLARVTARALARAIDGALALPAEPRRAAAERVRRSDAGGAIAAMLEALLAERRAVASA